MKKVLLRVVIFLSVIILGMNSPMYGNENDINIVTISDLIFKINGLAIKVGDNAKSVVDSLGKDYSLSEANSCLYSGMDKSYSYNDIVINTLPIKNADVISEIYITSDKYETKRGIKVGQKKLDIENAYGKDYTLVDGVLTYWIGEKENSKAPKIYFVLDEKDIITGISIFSMGVN